MSAEQTCSDAAATAITPLRFTTCTEIEQYNISLGEQEADFIIEQITNMLQMAPQNINWGQTFYYNKRFEVIQKCDFAHLEFQFLRTDKYAPLSHYVTCRCPDDSDVIETVTTHFKALGLETNVHISVVYSTKTCITVYFPKE